MHPWLGVQRLNRFASGRCQGNSGSTVCHGVSVSGWWGSAIAGSIQVKVSERSAEVLLVMNASL